MFADTSDSALVNDILVFCYFGLFFFSFSEQLFSPPPLCFFFLLSLYSNPDYIFNLSLLHLLFNLRLIFFISQSPDSVLKHLQLYLCLLLLPKRLKHDSSFINHVRPLVNVGWVWPNSCLSSCYFGLKTNNVPLSLCLWHISETARIFIWVLLAYRWSTHCWKCSYQGSVHNR